MTGILVVVTTFYVILTARIVSSSEGQRTAATKQADVAAAQLVVTQHQLESTEKQLNVARELLDNERKLGELQNDRDGCLSLINMMDVTQSDRAFVRECIKQKRKFDDLSNIEIERLDLVCRAFDILGLYDRRGLVNRHLVDEFYASPLVELYESYLGQYVDDIRQDERRGKTHLWELIQFYERVKYVPQHHPGVTGLSQWPDDAREVIAV